MSVVDGGNPPSMVEPSIAARPARPHHEATRLPRVGVVVLNWRRPRDILDCLASVTAQEYAPDLIEVVVVDNGSANGSVAEIRERFPAVTVIENGRNLGFAAGCNRGIAALLERGAEYVFLLNDDATCEPALLGRLVAEAETDTSIGMLGPTVYYADGSGAEIWSAGGMVDRLGHTSHMQATDGATTVRDVDYVTGCAILIRRSVIETVGMLDERFFAYWEEVEWCARARAAGYRVVQVPAARVWHGIQQEDRETSRFYQYLMTRNRLLFLESAGRGQGAVLLAALDIVRTALSWSIKPRHRAMRPYVGALLQALRDFTLRRFGAPPLPA